MGTVGRLGVGFLGLKYDIKALAIGTMVFIAIGMIITLFTKTFAIAVLYSCIVGIGYGGIMVAIMNILPNYFGSKNYPKILGFATAFFIVIGGLSTPIAGIIRDKTGSYMLYFHIGIILVIISIVLLILAKPPIHPSLKEGQSSELKN